jgi:uncharacterized membrane protein
LSIFQRFSGNAEKACIRYIIIYKKHAESEYIKMKSINSRPKIKLTRTKTEVVLAVFCGAALVFMAVYVFITYSRLPEFIPTHFGLSGKADGYGPRLSIVAMPVIAAVLFAGLTLLQKFPHAYNYPTEVTGENAPALYRQGRLLLAWMKTEILCMFAFILFAQGSTALGAPVSMFAPLMAFVGVLLGTLIVFVFRMVKKAHKQ